MCPVCGLDAEPTPCPRCGSIVHPSGMILPPRPDRPPPPRHRDPEVIAGLLALPGIDQEGAERLAAAGKTLEDILSSAFPRRARRSGFHHDLAIDLSLKVLQEVQVDLPALTSCGRCGGPVREADENCPSCGSRVFLGEPVASLDATLRAIEGDVTSFEQDMDYYSLPASYRAELEEALGAPEEEEDAAPTRHLESPRPTTRAGTSPPDVEAETQRLLSRGTRRRP